MNILFIGGTKRGYLTAKALLEQGAHVSGIVSLTQDAHEVERYEQPIERLAQAHNIVHYQTKALKERDYAKLIAEEIKPDVAFVVGCRILIPESIYGIPRLGTLAVHDSLLPNYRGFAPLNWAVLNGEKQTGVTLFYLDDRMDGGDIVGQRAVPILSTETAAEVYEKVCTETVSLVLQACAQLAQGSAPRRPQNYDEGSFTCSRTPDDGLVDWSASTQAIHDRVRALGRPYPGAFTFYHGEKMLLWKAMPSPAGRHYVGRIPGRVVAISPDGHVDVLTGDGVLRLLEVQIEGQTAASASSVIKSVKSTLGLSSVELLARIRTLEQQLRELLERQQTPEPGERAE
jgi:methionyl-tRNA formyltransferase